MTQGDFPPPTRIPLSASATPACETYLPSHYTVHIYKLPTSHFHVLCKGLVNESFSKTFARVIRSTMPLLSIILFLILFCMKVLLGIPHKIYQSSTVLAVRKFTPTRILPPDNYPRQHSPTATSTAATCTGRSPPTTSTPASTGTTSVGPATPCGAPA